MAIDLTPKMKILPAELELLMPPGTPQMGEKVGGFYAFSDVFKRGYGDKVFGNDSNGIWLGAADFPDAPFSVDMDGNIIARSISFLEASSVSVAASFNQQFTSVGTVTDVTSAGIVVTVGRPTQMLMIVDSRGWIFKSGGGAGDWSGEGNIMIYRDSTVIRSAVTYIGEVVAGDAAGDLFRSSYSMHLLTILDPGAYTLKLRAVLSASLNGGAFNIYDYRFTVINLGGVLS